MKKITLFVAVMLSVASVTAQQMVETVNQNDGGLVNEKVVEQVANESQSSGHKGLDFNFDLGGMVNLKGIKEWGVTADLELGKRFSESCYLGVGTGAYIIPRYDAMSIPFTTNFRYYITPKQVWSPFLDLKVGYLINGSATIDILGYSITLERPNDIMFKFMPGMQLPINETTDFHFGVGFSTFVPTEGKVEFAIGFTIGFGFYE